MKIGIFFEGSPKMGGGFFQSLKSSLLISSIDTYADKFEMIITDDEANDYFKKTNIKIKSYQLNIFKRYYSQLFEIDIVRNFFNKIKIKHPFSNFLKKENYDLVIFLGPSNNAKYCVDVSFVVNIWDLDHVKNSQFPEHNTNNIYDIRNDYLKKIIFKAFKIIVPHSNNKEDLINYFNADKKNITIQNFIPMLPTIYKKNKKKDSDYKNLFDKFDIPVGKKIIFYPAQFWAHKNHKYIVDAVEILKNKKENNFYFIFCGSDKGNHSYIKNIVNDKNLKDYFKFLNFITDDEIISLYLNSDAVIMPTYGGPTNLPIYESFYFRKPLFYSKDLIRDSEINKCLVGIDLENPADFCEKINIIFDTPKVNEIVKQASSYFTKVCDESLFINNYKKILDEFSYLLNRWKS